MEKLELKHLAGYLPYGLKAKDINTKEVRIVTLFHFTYDMNTVGYNHLLHEGLLLSKHLPILRPLSDLTKEIELNGEKFVPINELKSQCSYAVGCELDKFIVYKNYGDMHYWIIKKLYEWHFDIHGLIEKGLAIEINTLNQ